MKESDSDPLAHPSPSRRAFLHRATQGGLLTGAAAAGVFTAGKQNAPLATAPATSTADKLSYHESEHTRQYYRSLGIF